MRAKVVMIEAGNADQGQRIDNYLFKYFKRVPKSRVYRAIRGGEVRINGKRVKAVYKLIEGDVIRVPPIQQAVDDGDEAQLIIGQKEKDDMKARIIYEDDQYIIFNKNSGEAVHKGSGIKIGLIDKFQCVYGKEIYLAHRLDKDVSGCIMLTKNREAKKEIQAVWGTNKVEKKYWALVFLDSNTNKKEGDVFDINLSLKSENGKMQNARSEIEVLEVCSGYALLEVSLKTGRKHQIRRHLSESGMPIVGDCKYGNFSENKSFVKNNGEGRLMLHARSLKIDKKDGVFCIAEISKDFNMVLKLLGLKNK
ncbi:MAG: RluA family pseudouridine synthase [Pseudomonadota bacterium]|nr:RluA family pseudouridine synthase [Pseudomonadota bacterium]